MATQKIYIQVSYVSIYIWDYLLVAVIFASVYFCVLRTSMMILIGTAVPITEAPMLETQRDSVLAATRQTRIASLDNNNCGSDRDFSHWNPLSRFNPRNVSWVLAAFTVVVVPTYSNGNKTHSITCKIYTNMLRYSIIFVAPIRWRILIGGQFFLPAPSTRNHVLVSNCLYDLYHSLLCWDALVSVMSMMQS